MYLDHFKLTEYPFSLAPNTHFFYHLPSHQEAFNVLMFSIRSGEGFVKITGEVGSGKTLLCRKLLASLDESYMSAYIPNPDLSPLELRKAFARELEITIPAGADQSDIQAMLHTRLAELKKQQKKVLLLIDEAQTISNEGLETIRLLSNYETESDKLLQVILFAQQPEFDEKLRKYNLRQLRQRITFSYKLEPMSRQELDAYISHRLSISGYTSGASLFTIKARNLIYKYSKGIPRVINILCHKAMLLAFSQNKQTIDHQCAQKAINDTESCTDESKNTENKPIYHILSNVLLILLILVILGYFYFGVIPYIN